MITKSIALFPVVLVSWLVLSYILIAYKDIKSIRGDVNYKHNDFDVQKITDIIQKQSEDIKKYADTMKQEINECLVCHSSNDYGEDKDE